MTKNIITKHCRKCNQVESLSEFYSHLLNQFVVIAILNFVKKTHITIRRNISNVLFLSMFKIKI
jgi:hypothetical protein